VDILRNSTYLIWNGHLEFGSPRREADSPHFSCGSFMKLFDIFRGKALRPNTPIAAEEGLNILAWEVQRKTAEDALIR
jgi:hypothetical protein